MDSMTRIHVIAEHFKINIVVLEPGTQIGEVFEWSSSLSDGFMLVGPDTVYMEVDHPPPGGAEGWVMLLHELTARTLCPAGHRV